jgi:hypothetical protein
MPRPISASATIPLPSPTCLRGPSNLLGLARRSPLLLRGLGAGASLHRFAPAENDALDALFIRVFAGDGSAEDVHRMATQYACHTIVVSAQDGAWQHNPFAASADYRLAEDAPGRWRIYVVVER